MDININNRKSEIINILEKYYNRTINYNNEEYTTNRYIKLKLPNRTNEHYDFYYISIDKYSLNFGTQKDPNKIVRQTNYTYYLHNRFILFFNNYNYKDSEFSYIPHNIIDTALEYNKNKYVVRKKENNNNLKKDIYNVNKNKYKYILLFDFLDGLYKIDLDDKRIYKILKLFNKIFNSVNETNNFYKIPNQYLTKLNFDFIDDNKNDNNDNYNLTKKEYNEYLMERNKDPLSIEYIQ